MESRVTPNARKSRMAKSVGEIGINGVAAAIANAVNDAVGVRLRRLPMTAERVLDAMLEEGRAAGQ